LRAENPPSNYKRVNTFNYYLKIKILSSKITQNGNKNNNEVLTLTRSITLTLWIGDIPRPASCQ